MPEGDTIFRAARTLHRALGGKTIVRFESAFPALNRIDEDRPIAGRIVDAVSSRGKHLLLMFSGDLVLHTHMRMNGSWHIYRPGERWQRAARDMRIVLATGDFVAVGFNIPVAELLSGADLVRHRQLQSLGPDLAGDAFDAADVLRRMRGVDAPIADVILDQRIVAGIGNVLKSEVLFVSGVGPFVRAADLPEVTLARILGVARRLMSMYVEATLSPAPDARRPAASIRARSSGYTDAQDGHAADAAPRSNRGLPVRMPGSPIGARDARIRAAFAPL